MLSNLTIVSIFTEIFAAGILASGAITFIKQFILARKSKDLFFGLVFLSLFLYVAASLASQLMLNSGWSLGDRITGQKVVYLSLVFCSFFLWSFIIEKFELRNLRYPSILALLLFGYISYIIINSSINLVYSEGVIEPIVNFIPWIPVKPFFSAMWTLLAFLSLFLASRQEGGRRKLLVYTGVSSLLMLASLFSAYLYIRFIKDGYLLSSWLIFLASIIGLLLSELVPPAAPEALAPLRFLRSRILFKLMLIFVLLVVILFEATTLATITISRNTLSRSIQAEYLRVAEDLAEKIGSFKETPSLDQLQSLVTEKQVGLIGTAFVVDANGHLLAHPQKNRALQHVDMSMDGAVKKVLAGKSGADEFTGEFLTDKMVGAFVPVNKYGWGVVIEQDKAIAYADIGSLQTQSLLFVIIGIFLTALTGIFFARSIEKPIKELTMGTEAVARGELGHHIAVSSSDEIGELAKAFNQMTRDLRDSQERLILAEKLSSLGTMAAGMAHEIKNPLVSLRTFTQLLTQKWEDKEFREKFSSIIPNEIERINRIAESLLKFGRPMKPELTKVDVNSLLEEVLLLFESECKTHNVRVTKKLAELPEISGDAGQISQALVNIVKNAIESMHDKGGELIAKTDVGEVVKLGKMRREGTKVGDEMTWGEEEDLGRPIPVIFIEVTDTGEGIPEENLKSLFDPFFTTKMTGTGMGMPITLRIIEEHKGSIKVRSQPGKGTSFIITLPQRLH